MSVLSQKDFQSKKQIPTESVLIVDDLDFKTIINNLKSLQSKFEFTGKYVEKPSPEIDVEQHELIKTKLENTLIELSKLKNEIQFIDKKPNSELKYVVSHSLVNKKKPKSTKKSSNIRTKKPKSTKKSSNIRTKKPKSTKKSSNIRTKRFKK